MIGLVNLTGIYSMDRNLGWHAAQIAGKDFRCIIYNKGGTAMNELIDKDKVKEAIRTDYYEHFTIHHDTEQIALIDMVLDDMEDAPTVDPVHAAGGCYCRECRYCGAPAFTDGVLLCRRGNKPERKNRDDFCSCGKLKEEK